MLVDSNNIRSPSKLSVAQLVRFLVVEPAHPGSSLRLGTGARNFLDLFQDLTGTILSVVVDVPVDSEVPMVTSESRDQPAQSLGGAHRGRVACVFVSVCVCIVFPSVHSVLAISNQLLLLLNQRQPPPTSHQPVSNIISHNKSALVIGHNPE